MTWRLTHMDLLPFVIESNRIERIERPPTTEELDAHLRLATDDHLTVGDVSAFVRALGDVGHGGALRNRRGMDVQVGNHVAPRGGPEIQVQLGKLLDWASVARGTFEEHERDAHELYGRYEDLHPYMDGNGRSGRALWLQFMLLFDPEEVWKGYVRQTLFLNAYHYATLSRRRIG